ncbi:hypothetical protein KAH81_09420 [bacterium]|nr:hypothetical protein [bacterium]
MRNAIIILMALSIACFSANSILVYSFKSTSLDQGTVEAVKEILKAELTDNGYSAREAGEEVCNDAACASAGAIEYNVDQALYGSLAKLGEKIIVNMYIVDRDGNNVHSDKLTSETVEDLDIVISRLVKGFVEGVPSGETIDKMNVTATEAKEPVRRKNFYTIGVKIGYRFPLAESYGKEQMWQYEGMAMYELESMFVEGRGYGCSGGDAAAFGLSVGLYYIFAPQDFSPYVGGSAGIEWVMNMPYVEEEGDSSWVAGGASGDGPAISLGGGLIAFQTYDFRLMLDVRYTMVFLGEADVDFDDWSVDSEKENMGTEHSIAITIGISRRDIGENRSSSLCCMPW